jgi:hypothetical protein
MYKIDRKPIYDAILKVVPCKRVRGRSAEHAKPLVSFFDDKKKITKNWYCAKPKPLPPTVGCPINAP